MAPKKRLLLLMKARQKTESSMRVSDRKDVRRQTGGKDLWKIILIAMWVCGKTVQVHELNKRGKKTAVSSVNKVCLFEV